MKLSRTDAKDVKSYGFDSNDDTVHDVSMSSEVTIVVPSDACRFEWTFFFLIVRGIFTWAIQTVHISFSFKGAITIVLIEELFSEFMFRENRSAELTNNTA